MYRNIKITANRQDDEPFRLKRLNQVLGYVAAKAEQNKCEEAIDHKLWGIHDHKGNLTVTWVKEPFESEKKFFVDAWLSWIGDCGDSVEHEVLPESEGRTSFETFISSEEVKLSQKSSSLQEFKEHFNNRLKDSDDNMVGDEILPYKEKHFAKRFEAFLMEGFNAL